MTDPSQRESAERERIEDELRGEFEDLGVTEEDAIDVAGGAVLDDPTCGPVLS